MTKQEYKEYMKTYNARTMTSIDKKIMKKRKILTKHSLEEKNLLHLIEQQPKKTNVSFMTEEEYQEFNEQKKKGRVTSVDKFGY